MIYGILLESIRVGICLSYGNKIWKKIINELSFEYETFTILGRYEENLIENISQCLADILHEGTPDYYMQFFGQCFVNFFTNYGYDKILRVAGRYFRDFLHSIDQLHDSNKFSFPKMKSPLFHVIQEDQNGLLLQYKSYRRGFQRYIIGQLKECALKFYDEEIYIRIEEDMSNNQGSFIIFRIDFNNSSIKQIKNNLNKMKIFSDIKSETFFNIFPFSILIDSQMNILFMGLSILNIFPLNEILIGKSFNQIFKLIRPDIDCQWNNLISYGRHIVFIIENKISLENSNEINLIRLKGQMKYIENWNKIVFLCHPILSTTEEMNQIGLSINDLNFYDGTSEILISSMQHNKQLQSAIEKQHAWISKLQNAKMDLKEWRRKGKDLLYSIMPRHIAKMLEEGIVPNSICESHKLITILFCYTLDFKDILQKLSPIEIVESINKMIILFDQTIDKYHVFKIETKADSSYMIVSGIQDRILRRKMSNDSNSSILSSSIIEDKKFHMDLNQCEIISGLALDLLNQSKILINKITNKPFEIKMGFHSGSAVGGIVGHKNYQYCLFGDTINTASRITTTSDIGNIHLSSTSWQLLKDSIYFKTIQRGFIQIKGKGEMETYWLIGSTDIYKNLLSNIENSNKNLSSSIHSTLSNKTNINNKSSSICPFTNFKF